MRTIEAACAAVIAMLLLHISRAGLLSSLRALLNIPRNKGRYRQRYHSKQPEQPKVEEQDEKAPQSSESDEPWIEEDEKVLLDWDEGYDDEDYSDENYQDENYQDDNWYEADGIDDEL